MDLEWFERNPNKTYIIALVGCFFISGVGVVTNAEAVTNTIRILVMLYVSVWILRIKDCSMWWILLMGFLSPLLVRNRGKYSQYYINEQQV
jgi:hypothetical protein